MPRVKHSAHAAKGAKGKGKGKGKMVPTVTPAKMPTVTPPAKMITRSSAVITLPSLATHSKLRKSISGTEASPRASFGDDSMQVTTCSDPTLSGRASSASREQHLPPGSSESPWDSSLDDVSSGGGKGKTTPLPARKHAVKSGKKRRYRPGTLALREIRRL